MLPVYRGEILSQITRLEPGESLEEDFYGAGMEGHLAYRFLPLGNGTKPIQRETVRYRGLLRPFELLIKPLLVRRCQERLESIKEVLEGGWSQP